MRFCLLLCACLGVCFAGLGADLTTATTTTTTREVIGDNHFQQGFTLWEPKPGQHIRYGELKGIQSTAKPVWGLSQWSSKFPLDPATLQSLADGGLVCSNLAKGISVAPGKSALADFCMAVNTQPEYGDVAKKAGAPWVHLLVEQAFEAPAALSNIASAKLHVEARLLRSRNLHHGDYTPDVHAAQFKSSSWCRIAIGSLSVTVTCSGLAFRFTIIAIVS